MVEDDISQLIVSGSPSKEQLDSARLSIVSQYQEACPNPVSEMHLRIAKRTEDLHYKIVRVTYIIGCLKLGYNPILIEELRKEKYKHPLTPATLQKDLENIEGALRGDLHKLTLAKAEYKKLEDDKDKKPATAKTYRSSVLQYDAVFKTDYALKYDQLMTSTYCDMMNALQEHYKTLTSK